MTTPLPLFSLPYIPLKQVLDNFGVQGILYLSMCSQRAKSVVVSYRGPSKNVKLSLQFGDRNGLSYMEGDDSHILLNVENRSELTSVNRNLATVRVGNFCNIPVEMGKFGLNTYWEDRMTGISEIGDYAREVFNQDIYRVVVINKLADDASGRAAKWISKSQKSVQFLHCFSQKINNDLDFILQNFKYTEKLLLQVKPPLNYCPAKPPNFHVDILYIIFSCWIKQCHLLAMNCQIISLHNSKLTSRDFNVFVKHWMTGGCPQLRKLGVDVEESIDYEVVLDGVEFVEREQDVEWIYVDEEKRHIIIRGGFDINGPSGDVKATIINGGENWKHFWMIVWPDFAGNFY